MKTPLEKNDSYLIAKEKVRKIKRFYLHLIVYILVVILWAILISLHAWIVFKGRLFFKKSWEERKLKEYMGKEETKWE